MDTTTITISTYPIVVILIRIGLAAGFVILGFALARWVRRVMRRGVANPRVSDYLGPSVREILVRATFYAIIVLSVGFALVALGVPASYVIAGLAIILIILGVALQQSLANLTATIIFIIYQPFHRGELVETMGQMGVVQEIQLFNTVLLTADQRVVSLANSKIQEAGVVNYSRIGYMRADAQLTLAYSADLSTVRSLLLDLARSDSRVLAEPPPDVVVLAMGEAGITVALRVFAHTEDYWQVLFDLRERVTARLAQAGIEFARSQSLVTLQPGSAPGNDQPVTSNE